jgi:hypothetical protein
MIKSTNCFFAATLAAISAVTAFPCQAETVGDLTILNLLPFQKLPLHLLTRVLFLCLLQGNLYAATP